MDQYPTIKFIVEHGNAIAIVIAVLPLLAALACVGLVAMHWLVLGAGS